MRLGLIQQTQERQHAAHGLLVHRREVGDVILPVGYR